MSMAREWQLMSVAMDYAQEHLRSFDWFRIAEENEHNLTEEEMNRVHRMITGTGVQITITSKED